MNILTFEMFVFRVETVHGWLDLGVCKVGRFELEMGNQHLEFKPNRMNYTRELTGKRMSLKMWPSSSVMFQCLQISECPKAGLYIGRR